MSKYAAHPSRIYLDEFDFSGSLTSTSLDITQEAPVITSFADTGPRRAVGNYEFAQSHSGLFESTDNGVDEQTFLLLADGTDHYLTQLFGANVAGTVAYDSIVQLTANPRSAAIGGAVLMNFDTAGGGGLSRGVVLASKTSTAAETIPGATDGWNQGATISGQSLRAIFRVFAFTGTSITMKIQHCATQGGSYVDVTSLTSTAMTANQVQSVTVTSATNAWKHVVTTGTYSSALILVTLGTVQGT